MGLKPIQVAIRLFDASNSPSDLDRSRRAMTWLMFGLIQANVQWLEAHPETPRLLTSKVRYRPEYGTEIWQDIPTTLRQGYGDCEDLAMWRCAELIAQGIGAMPYITWRTSPGAGNTIYHALVRWPDGKIEDPSRALGMRGHPITGHPVFIDQDMTGITDY